MIARNSNKLPEANQEANQEATNHKQYSPKIVEIAKSVEIEKIMEIVWREREREREPERL